MRIPSGVRLRTKYGDLKDVAKLKRKDRIPASQRFQVVKYKNPITGRILSVYVCQEAEIEKLP